MRRRCLCEQMHSRKYQFLKLGKWTRVENLTINPEFFIPAFFLFYPNVHAKRNFLTAASIHFLFPHQVRPSAWFVYFWSARKQPPANRSSRLRMVSSEWFTRNIPQNPPLGGSWIERRRKQDARIDEPVKTAHGQRALMGKRPSPRRRGGNCEEAIAQLHSWVKLRKGNDPEQR